MDSAAWTVVAVFLGLTFAIGLWFTKRASQSTEEYFLSGRTLPWWILGTSMVVTTFAPDTPLGVAEQVRTGISYGWFGWNMVMGQVLAVFLFARLWRRSGVTTDNELLELRYHGKAAAGLRFYKACHFAILANLITLSVVLRAIVSVIMEVAALDPSQEGLVAWVLAGVALLYAVLAGFWGVVATDFLQFWVAIAGTTVFAFMASDDLGGLGRVAEVAGSDALAFFPSESESQFKVLAYMLVMWWATYVADGGGYLCQRMLAAKNEWHASVGTLWFSVAYAAIRMWPWVVIGSLSLLVFPTLGISREGELRVNGRAASTISGPVEVRGADGTMREEVADELPIRIASSGASRKVVTEDGREVRAIPSSKAYPRTLSRVMAEHPLLMGIIVAAFLAAYLSTVDTLLNWGASYLVNDVLRRFIAPKASERSLVWAAKGTVVAIMVGSVLCFQFFQSIKDAWIFTWSFSAGIGPVLLLRWFWWRINAWCEILALATSVTFTLGCEVLNGLFQPGGYVFASRVTWIGTGAGAIRLEEWHKVLMVVGLSLVAIAVGIRVRPAQPAHLQEFVRRVRPPGFWGPVRDRLGSAGRPDHALSEVLIRWALGVSVVYGLTFLVGGIIYQRWDLVVGSAIAVAVGSVGLGRRLARERRARPGN